jgi:hypothetical protein
VVQALLDLDRARPRPCRLFVVDGAKGLTKATVLAITMIIAGTAETVGVFLHHAGQSGDARVGQNRPKLTCCQASSTIAVGTAAGNVVDFFMAYALHCGFDTPSLQAQGEQRLPSNFNINRDIFF